MGDDRRPDPGLQPERTALAWQRIALALVAAALIPLRALGPTVGLVVVAVMAIGLVGAAAAWRGARRAMRHARANASTSASGALLLTTAVVVTASAAAGLLWPAVGR